MKTYLISYDLNSSGKDYVLLINEIKRYASALHILDSVWVVQSSVSSKELRNHLLNYIDENDEIIVTELLSNTAWRLTKQKSTRLKSVILKQSL